MAIKQFKLLSEAFVRCGEHTQMLRRTEDMTSNFGWLGSRGTKFLIVLIGSLLFAVAWSLHLGQDSDADLKGYHLYNAFALLHGRWGVDFAAAGHRTFFNPLLDVPYYLLSVEILPTSPRLVAAIQGLYYGALIFAAFLVNLRVFGEEKFPWSFALVATAIGVTGAVTLSEVGTVFNNIQIAALLLFGLAILLPSLDDVSGKLGYARPTLAGFMFGIAGGLKLTGVIYAPAAVCALLVISGPPTFARLKLAALFSLGWLLGFALVEGWWAWFVWKTTGNPLFPFFNNIFHSDFYPAVLHQSGRMEPKGLGQAIFAPFYWIVRQFAMVTEGTWLRDGRLAAAYLAIVFLVASPLWARLTRSSVAPLTPPARFMIVFAIVAYTLWVMLFFSLRLGLILETLSGTLILLGLARLSDVLVGPPRQAAAALALGALLGAVLWAWTISPMFGRQHFRDRVFLLHIPPLPSGSLILTGDEAAYFLPFLNTADFSAVGATRDSYPGYRLFDEAADRIAKHRGSIYILMFYRAANMDMLSKLGLSWREADCLPVKSNLFVDLSLCPAEGPQ
jgi:hypothetical protein